MFEVLDLLLGFGCWVWGRGLAICRATITILYPLTTPSRFGTELSSLCTGVLCRMSVRKRSGL